MGWLAITLSAASSSLFSSSRSIRLKEEGHYTEEKTIARAEAALKRMLNTPPKPHSEMKIGKRKAKATTNAKAVRRRKSI
jgi:hypothetical protein